MRAVVVSESGARVTKEGEELRITLRDSTVQRVRLGEVSRLLLLGQVELTSSARNAVLRRGIDTVFLTKRGDYRGRLVGTTHGNVDTRIGQYRSLLDEETAARLASAFVRGKVVNQRRLLQRFQSRRPQDQRAEAIVSLDSVLRQLPRADSVDNIRGLEGMAAADYFAVFGTLLTNPSFEFSQRTRRPPKDPVNAMLSFGYALLQVTVEGAVYRAGLDPYLGSLHAPRANAQTLVFDLMEEFRPVAVDSVVLNLVNHRSVKKSDFRDIYLGYDAEEFLSRESDEKPGEDKPHEHGVHLAATGREIVMRSYFKRLRQRAFYPPRNERLTLERIVGEQAYQLARVLRGEGREYVAYQPR